MEVSKTFSSKTDFNLHRNKNILPVHFHTALLEYTQLQSKYHNLHHVMQVKLYQEVFELFQQPRLQNHCEFSTNLQKYFKTHSK